jgi:ferrous iron transport protein B
VVCVILIDEARRHGLQVDDRQLARDLGVPVVLTAARRGEGLPQLLEAIHGVATGQIACRPHRMASDPPVLRPAVRELVDALQTALPGLPNARWVALRLLGGDEHIAEALRRGELGQPTAAGGLPSP